LVFDLRISNPFPEQTIQSAIVRCQIQIEVARRRYESSEQSLLRELFDDPARWGDTLRPLTWTNTFFNIPGFSGVTTYALPVPCTFEWNTATAKYFYGLVDGDIPLTFLFSGSVFYSVADGPLQVAPISWNKEARFRLPLQIWRDLRDLHYPNVTPVMLQRDVFDDLYRFKISKGFATFEEAIRQMLSIAERERPVS
jgi:hypothetical protein